MKIELTPYDPEWPARYEAERERLTAALGPLIKKIEHIGSTSIPGISAKPIIDVQVGVISLEHFLQAGGADLLRAACYEYFPHFEKMAPFRRFFVRNDGNTRRANIHLVSADHPWFQRHLYFRDYLRSSPEARDRYEALKQQLAAGDWKDSGEYAEAKSELISRLEEEAYELFGLRENLRKHLRATRV